MTNSDEFKPADGMILRRAWLIGLLLVFALAILTRCFLGGKVQYPGHGDAAFYYTVAENIADGRGLEIDYIWHFLNHPRSITHESHDYWMPMTSVILALPLLVAGKSISVAIAVSAVVGLLIGLVTYSIAIVLTRSKSVSLVSAAVVLFIPALFDYSLQPDSAIFYALFVSLSLYFLMRSLDRPVWFLPAGAFVGLSQLTRQDGALLVVVLTAVVFVSHWPRRDKWLFGLGGLGLYLLVLSPLVAANFKIYGSPFPRGPSRTVFLTEYEDLYTYSKELSFRAWLDWGFVNIIRSKLRMIAINLYTFYKTLGDFLAIFLVVGILKFVADRKRSREHASTEAQKRRSAETGGARPYLPALLFAVLLFAAYSLLYTFSKSFERSSVALMPFVVPFVVGSVFRSLQGRFGMVAMALLIGSLAVQSVQTARHRIRADTETGRRLGSAGAVIEKDASARGDNDIVVMTRDPWELYNATRYKAVQIPNDDMDTILEVARKFGVDYVILPAPRAALEELYRDRTTVEWLTFVGRVPDSEFKVYRIAPE